ncbi:MAG: hypothetical protein V3U85_06685 [Hyphomicrobium sp.]
MKTAGKANAPSVSTTHLAAAVKAATAMSIKEKELICDTLYATQPNLLASVLVQSSLGASMETVDVLLNILIVLHLAVEKSGQVLVTVSEAEQERQLQRFTATVRFTEGLDERSFAQSIRQTTAHKQEKILLAYVIDTIQRAGFVDRPDENAKYPMIAAINLVNCIATAKRISRNKANPSPQD